MSVYPFSIDSDETIIRIDDNITELGGEAINQIRDAVFAIEGELGLELSGSLNTLADRLNVFLNANGTIKQSALAAIGLVTLPISDNQIAVNAGIKEYKLSLDHKTSDLYTIIVANKSLLDAVNAFLTTVNTNFLNHLAGTTFLVDGETSARHVASHIDLNTVPSDPRDPFFSWTGLKNNVGGVRTATQVATALLQINDDLVNHENSTSNAHTASAISVDVSQFEEIPSTANTVQKVFDYLENAEELNIGEHRAVQHANGIPATARSQSLINTDGYGGDTVVPLTTVNAYLVDPPANSSVDNNTLGDDIVKFKPIDTNFVFDSQFSQVKIGDILQLNYGNGVTVSFEVESIRFNPGVEWIIRINGSNLFNAVDGYVDGYAGIATARIDRPQYDVNTTGVLALGSANSIPSNLYTNLLGSVIVGHPRGATALGLGFDGNKLNSSHYKLWLQLYPTGNPVDNTVTLPFIDVTGDAGISPGSYTLDKVVQATNDAFRKIGYNYRFIAFAHKGDFGIMLADPINKASFAIINGSNQTGTVITDVYTQNVVSDATDGDTLDPFGFGSTAAKIASPAYQAAFTDATAAQNPTRIITPVKKRFYIVNGRKLDTFAPTLLANNDGYWPASISAKISTGSSVEVTYKINLDLRAAKLKPGKTIVVQPDIVLTDSRYSINDYGRFIIKQVIFAEPCGSVGATTTITVINGIHANGNGVAFSSDPGLPVRLFFSEDSVGFNDLNIIDSGITGMNYHRYHEIYINRDGATFSHERARMKDDQAEATPPTSLLRSDFWHIKSVSPKLRGYRDNTVSFNKYVRFYVTRYDPTSGEFDGYIGRRNPSNNGIANQGPLTTSRKGVTTKFYDETYVDFVELEFKELAFGPTGTAILSDSNPRYVDIEIFPTLRLDDENMLIGSCEINWHQPAGQNIVQYVRDLRDFGSVGPANFNNSAVDFISAGDRLLHENGVVRGFQYIPTGTTNTTGQLFFNGGVALVNGKIITTNNSSITIPPISNAGSTGVTVTWAICVNEFGYLQSIILTSSKSQIFAGSGSLYYVPSITFDELISSRKDLTLLATVDAHIASITINDSDVNDLRRFVGNEGANTYLVLTQDVMMGNFHSFTTVKQWINHTNSNNNHVTVRGIWNISTPVDLTGFNKKVIFESDGAQVTVSGLRGFLLGSNVTLKNFVFNYASPSVSPNPGDFVVTGNGLLYANANNLNNISVIDCQFISNLATPRSPYINIETDSGEIINNCRFVNNFFSDSINSNTSAAIAIVCLNTSNNSSLPSLVSNVEISGNVCDRFQGIVISCPEDFIISPGINIISSRIINNSCGYIGYWSTSVANTNIQPGNLPSGLIITGNTCHFIATAMSTGRPINIVPAPNCGFGSVIVSENFSNWIHIFTQAGSGQLSSTIIESNILTGYDFFNFLEPFTNFVTTNTAIRVEGNLLTANTDNTTVQILNNNISAGVYGGTTYKYYGGIYSQVGGNIRDNIVKGFVPNTPGTFLPSPTLDGYGILIQRASGDGVRNYSITQNQIYRGSDIIGGYIAVGSAEDLPTTGVISNNIFDSTTVDGTSTKTILAPVSWFIEKNKNQIVTQVFSARDGLWAVNDILYGVQAAGTSTIVNGVASHSQTLINYANASNNEVNTWKIPLLGVVPYGATILSLQITASIGSSAPTTKTITLTLNTINTDIFGPTALTTTPTAYQVTLSHPHIVVPDPTGSNVPEVIVSVSITNSGDTQVTLNNFTISYKW